MNSFFQNLEFSSLPFLSFRILIAESSPVFAHLKKYMEPKTPANYGFTIGLGKFEAVDNMCNKGGTKFEVLKRHIPGNVGLMPTRDYDSRFMCYIDDEGIPKQLFQNELAAYVLDFLGFDVHSCVGGLVLGPVVIVNNEDHGITKEQAQVLSEVCAVFDTDPEANPAEKLGMEKMAIIFGRIKAEKMFGTKQQNSSSSSGGEEEEEEGELRDMPDDCFNDDDGAIKPPAPRALTPEIVGLGELRSAPNAPVSSDSPGASSSSVLPRGTRRPSDAADRDDPSKKPRLT
jgi:hypothetical protein